MLALNPNLVPSHTLYPCHSHGYTEYIETPTVDNTLTMDVYTLPAKADMVKRCESKFIAQILLECVLYCIHSLIGY